MRDYSNARSFSEMGKVIYVDESQGLVIRAGQVFECKTVKGNTNLILTFGVRDGWMYYGHGDKGRKTRLEDFVRAVLSGDIQPRGHKEIDPERMEMSMIALDAIAHRRTGEETINYYGDHAEERFLRGA